ncbi:MAG: 4-hydroxy-tetrahydrodipicolinate synthase [Sulfobacillus acidophilus]|uniref:4-hydroxy-tetrahydrodipicolinate synthase n=1 Tax=Sulfobacillus acidophilus TaxID=53633 RepID=A0A2T2WHN8_9FIRM|nr:MAG: 4-hydroxy-tetrahydrodipicolinate synthase [Sulfobacillus acidophilus]
MHWPVILTAMITPFASDGSLSEERAQELAGWLVANGSDGLVVAGTTGESPTLSQEERMRLLKAARAGAGSAPVWMGCGTNSTTDTIANARDAEKWGADGILLVTPYYNRPPQEGLYQHFVQVANAVSCPVMIYNVPGRTGVSLAPETMARIIAECRNVQAVKESSGTLEAIWAMRENCPGLKVYAGDDALFYPSLAIGAQGIVSVAAHLVGPLMVRLAEAYQRGRVDEARALHQSLLPLVRELFSWPNPIPVKWAVNRLGFAAGPLRLPLVYPTDPNAFDRLDQLITALAVSPIKPR